MSLKEKLLDIIPESGISNCIQLVPFIIFDKGTEISYPVIGLKIDLTEINNPDFLKDDIFFNRYRMSRGEVKTTFLIDLTSGAAHWDPFAWNYNHLKYAHLHLMMNFENIKPYITLYANHESKI